MASSRSSEGSAPSGGFPRHTFREQDALWAELLALGDAVVGSLEKCVQAVCEGRLDLIAEVKEEEEESDRKEVKIEQECLRVLALYEPVASDLRRLATVLKVNRDWERVADLALRVARRVRKLARKHPEIVAPEDLKDLARAVFVHVKASQTALKQSDAEAARKLIAGDQTIDDAYRNVRRGLKEQLAAHADQLDGWLLLLNSARNLERIADHATGIAQAVIFLQEGTIVRHSAK
ncbi:phosphate signaling complex protein PhoU [Paludisphaera rhizosphaerae]|uniref:phosphate signaling complex protein PhoU n=1 Tax=Paludisphaera rhizosphaerae TaxID=2711216 RepID=UPI0013EDCA3C|nr:phosphate signaling complex protein PhoU [Paludisphaera rhizosphaerae]